MCVRVCLRRKKRPMSPRIYVCVLVRACVMTKWCVYVLVCLGGGSASGMTAEGRKKQKRTTMPYMTKYERARILGTRAIQIAMNAPVMVRTLPSALFPQRGFCSGGSLSPSLPPPPVLPPPPPSLQ